MSEGLGRTAGPRCVNVMCYWRRLFNIPDRVSMLSVGPWLSLMVLVLGASDIVYTICSPSHSSVTQQLMSNGVCLTFIRSDTCLPGNGTSPLSKPQDLAWISVGETFLSLS